MNMATIIVGGIVFLGIAFAARSVFKTRKKGGCSGCPGCGGQEGSCGKSKIH